MFKPLIIYKAKPGDSNRIIKFSILLVLRINPSHMKAANLSKIFKLAWEL